MPPMPGRRDLVAEAARELGDERAPVRDGASTAPDNDSAAARNVADRHEQREHEPADLGVAGRGQRLVELADLRQEQVGRDEQTRKRQHRAQRECE